MGLNNSKKNNNYEDYLSKEEVENKETVDKEGIEQIKEETLEEINLEEKIIKERNKNKTIKRKTDNENLSFDISFSGLNNKDYLNIIKENEGIESDYAANIFYHMLEESDLLEKYIHKHSQQYKTNTSELGFNQLEKIANKEEEKHKELKKLFISKMDPLSEYNLLEKILLIVSGTISKKMKQKYEERLEIKYENELRSKQLGYLENLKDSVAKQEKILKEMSSDYRNKLKENFSDLKKSIKEYKLYSDSIKKVHLKNEEDAEKSIISELDEDLRNWEVKREELATDIKLYNMKNKYLGSRLSRIKMKRDHFSNIKNKLYYNINWIKYRIDEEEKRVSLKDLIKNIKELEDIVNLNSLFDKTESEFIKEYEKMPGKDFLLDYNSTIESEDFYENYAEAKSRNIRDAESIIKEFESKYGQI